MAVTLQYAWEVYQDTIVPACHVTAIRDFRTSVLHFVHSLIVPVRHETSSSRTANVCFWDTLSLDDNLEVVRPLCAYNAGATLKYIIDREVTAAMGLALEDSVGEHLESILRSALACQDVKYFKDGRGKLVAKGVPGSLDPAVCVAVRRLATVSILYLATVSG